LDPTARGIDISLPLTPQEGWVLLILLALFAVSLLVYWSRRHMLPSARHEERRTLGALDTFAILLAPVWLLLIALVLYNLWRLTQDFGTDLRPEDLRWHILAFVGLITALGALVSAPLALIRVYTTERQTRVAEQGHVTDQINKAVAGLGAEKEVKRQRTNTVARLSTRMARMGSRTSRSRSLRWSRSPTSRSASARSTRWNASPRIR
jgi:hypothetical protein